MGKTIKAKTRRGEADIGTAFVKGFAVSVIAEIILLAVSAAATSAGIIDQGIMPVPAVVSALLSAFAGAIVCGRSAPKLSLPLALGVGAAELAVNFLLGLLIAEGCGFTPVMPAAFMAGAAAGGIISIMGKSGKRRVKTLRC